MSFSKSPENFDLEYSKFSPISWELENVINQARDNRLNNQSCCSTGCHMGRDLAWPTENIIRPSVCPSESLSKTWISDSNFQVEKLKPPISCAIKMISGSQEMFGITFIFVNCSVVSLSFPSLSQCCIRTCLQSYRQATYLTELLGLNNNVAFSNL